MSTLFFDIETVAAIQDRDRIMEIFKQNRYEPENLNDKMDLEIQFTDFAGLHAEYGQIVCISVGYFIGDRFHTVSFIGEDELKLLSDFFDFVNEGKFVRFVGHNIKGFDIPFMLKRAAIKRLSVPQILRVTGKKPWELDQFLDTLEVWKYGNFKGIGKLDELAQLFGLPSPKEEMSGADVHNLVRNDPKWVPKVAKYCEGDVRSSAGVYFYLRTTYSEIKKIYPNWIPV